MINVRNLKQPVQELRNGISYVVAFKVKGAHFITLIGGLGK